jgi:hypothetical protein
VNQHQADAQVTIRGAATLGVESRGADDAAALDGSTRHSWLPCRTLALHRPVSPVAVTA